MSWLIHFIARFYPRSWRERYGAEFAALLEDVRPDGRTAANVLAGAFAMHIRAWKSWKILAASTAFSVVVSVAVYLASPKLYHGVVSVNFPGHVDPPEGSDNVYKLSRADFADIIAREHLYARERTKRPLDEVIEQMRKRLTIETSGASLSVAFDDTDPYAVQRVGIDIFSLFVGRWGARANVRISNVRPDPTWIAHLPYRREAGRGLIVAGLSSFLLMFGVLDFWQRWRLRKA